jgi:hypothetical protein
MLFIRNSHLDNDLFCSSPKNIPVYHCCTGHLGTLTWGKAIEYGLQHLDTICMENAITFPHLQFTENR